MIELPEAVVLAGQINQTLVGKRIKQVVANQSPHKFAWYTGDPATYHDRLGGRTIRTAAACAGEVEIIADEMQLICSAALRFYPAGEKRPARHQLLLAFEDNSVLVATIQMWGCLFCVQQGEPVGFEDYRLGRERPSPLSDAFDRVHFDSLLPEDLAKLSAKAFLATEQRIPGLGNGVLQDILWTAKINPRRKMDSLKAVEQEQLFRAVKSVLREMTNCGGRDTERDLFGCPGGYRTILSKNTVGQPCPACGALIQKEAYLGGSVYFCPVCQIKEA
ncbi:MAG: endonuclease VIII [Anaerolineaceae bacterium]|nr:endonuclease VIII [Anaerolineaceae bacterium]